MTERRGSSRAPALGTLGAVIALIVLLSLGLAWASNAFQSIQGWASFLGALLIAAGLLAGAWYALRSEALPRRLAYLVLGAALLRLAFGVVWSVALPVLGYGTAAEKGGYVMADAYDRDRVAYNLANSPNPLWKAFQTGYHKADQYGGLLFLSAWLYRYLLPPTHQPLLIVVITSAFSALGVLFVWVFARRGLFPSGKNPNGTRFRAKTTVSSEAVAPGEAVASSGSLASSETVASNETAVSGETVASNETIASSETIAWIAAWGLALYPEAVLLGSSQMREAFLMTLVVVAFYGLVHYWQERTWTGLAWMLGALALCVPLSPPVAGLLMFTLGILAVGLGRQLIETRLTRSRLFWLLVGLLVVLVVAGVWLSWREIPHQAFSNPIDLAQWWVKKSAEWQAYLSQRASGKIQALFKRTPAWSHLPMLLAYGVAQPFLPATLIDITSAWIWRLITIWRSLGWMVLLVFLVYAPLPAWLRKPRQAIAASLTIIAWLVILAASYRSGGDLWDGPRYRAMYAGLQVALAAWAWVEYRRTRDPWLRRFLVSIALVLAWFLPWYLNRYIHLPWPVTDELKVLGLGIASAVLYLIWDWVGTASTPTRS